MKELFIRESGDKKVWMTGVVTIIAAFLFLIIFAGCAPAEQGGAANASGGPAVTDAAR